MDIKASLHSNTFSITTIALSYTLLELSSVMTDLFVFNQSWSYQVGESN